MRQKLGQHFLNDPAVLKKIVAALQISGAETIIEIGPGHGELTNFILAEAAKHKKIKTIAIERDAALSAAMRATHVQIKNLQVITGDALLEIPKFFKNPNPKKIKIVGNIPYYLTGRLLRILGDSKHKPARCVFLVQKEVALRITAEPPQMNHLAAAVCCWAEPEIIGFVPRGSFRPPPEVESAIIVLKLLPTTQNSAQYYPLIKTLFQQPRKTILNNLSSGLGLDKQKTADILMGVGVLTNRRPGDLSLTELKLLTKIFSIYRQ